MSSEENRHKIKEYTENLKKLYENNKQVLTDLTNLPIWKISREIWLLKALNKRTDRCTINGDMGIYFSRSGDLKLLSTIYFDLFVT